jgi:succinate dehydrogenase/fumarate reductase flavoprotein subunit
MRARVLAAKVTVLDHYPALELWSDGTSVTGASGLIRPDGQDWTVRARAVVLATGGCAFFEWTSCVAGLTGDGLLMAAEAGAALSGMGFTGKHTLTPYGSSAKKGLPFRWASFYRTDGTPLLNARGEQVKNGIGGGAEGDLARALIEGPVYARLDQCEPALEDWLRQGQPNVMQPYDRQGIDPFRDLFRVDLKPEGTVRGVGGLRVATQDCGTDVPGLCVAGDTASRENVAGALSGGGSINSSWAIASGWWAGQGAAAHARRRRAPRAFRQHAAPLGQAGLRPEAAAEVASEAVIAAIRAEMAPLGKNFFRPDAGLVESLARLDLLWREVACGLGASGAARLRARETAAALAAARFCLTAARARSQSRGMHRRTDHPGQAEGPVRRYPLTGPDQIVPAAEPLPVPQEAAS